ncbi:MAG: hypothetical protein JW863_03310 [Chitinispirillaceae bacterium]|nr:hypothetical protein [Chitinispirillaceae bacterium]
MKKLSGSVVVMIGIGLLVSNCSRTVTGGTGGDGDLPENARMVNLVWKPTLSVQDFDLEPLGIYKSIGVSFFSISDIRQDPRIIGKTFEDLKIRKTMVPIATKVNIARWCKSAFESTCHTIAVKNDNKKGSLRLEIEITDFSINDDYTQTGTASLRINALTGDGMLIWEGRINGTSDLYVHGTDSDGISECLSNTVMVTLHNVFADQSFRDAVEKSIQ